jgi:hypothetical protein
LRWNERSAFTANFLGGENEKMRKWSNAELKFIDAEVAKCHSSAERGITLRQLERVGPEGVELLMRYEKERADDQQPEPNLPGSRWNMRQFGRMQEAQREVVI